MLNIPEALKDIYKNDRFPFTDEVTPKDLTVYFPALDLTIGTDQIVDDSFELSESICTADDLIFGSCEAAQIKFTVANVEQDLKGQWFTISQVIDGYEPVPLGTFKVDSCVKQDNLRFKEITAYNILKYTDVNVADWYNSLFPTGNETYTLKQFRQSLLNYLGIEYEDENLPNDDMTVTKTIEPTSISGREVLRRCVELQGGFGQVNRYGKFYHKILQPAYGLYPTENLYPSDELFPIAENDTTYINETLIDETISRHEGITFEEYEVKEIDKLIIRSEEDDVGAIYGIGTNAYIIQGNFLVYGKSAAELQQIARNAFENMAKRPYKPYEGKCVGLPYIEPGDTVQYENYGNPIVGYVLQKTLTGIQVLTDEFLARGSEEREQNFGVNEEIIQLQGKVTRIKKDVEGVSVEVEDLVEETSSKFEQTYNKITQEVTDAKNELSGQIDVLAGQVILKVDGSGNIAAVELGADPSQGTSIKIKADNISLEGLVTANGYFKILPDGSMEATNGKFSGQLVAASGTFTGTLLGADGTFTGTLSGNTIVSPNISGGNISGTVITSSGATVGSLEINGAYIRGRNTSGSITLDIWPGGIQVNGGIFCDTINGYVPITAGNIGSQSVSYAENAWRSTLSDIAYSLCNNSNTRFAYISANDNFIPSSSDMYIGSSANKWAGVYTTGGVITSSDQRLKTDIKNLDTKYLKFIKKVTPRMYKLTDGTSGRYHLGFIAQEIEKTMEECDISGIEFAGLIKTPVYENNLFDKNGNVVGYDTNSKVIDYTYHLRYDEFIAPILLYLQEIDARLTNAGF